MRRLTLIVLSLSVLVVGGCVNRDAQKQAKRTEQILRDPTKPVTVEPIGTRSMRDLLELTGQVTTGEDVAVGSKNPGKLISVYVRDGDSVSAGQLLATQDTSTQMISMQQAQAQVSAAMAALSQARQNAIVGPRRSTAALETARAQLRSAKAQLQKALNGARPEERRQAEAAVAGARSAMETAKKQAERARELFNADAISRSQLEVAENTYQGALSQYQSALETLSLSKNSARAEDISSARESVRQAEEGVRSAEAQKSLDSLLTEQVRAAEANLRSAQAAVGLIQQQVSDAQIRAPFSGRVYGRPAQPGSVVGAGSPVVRIIGSGGVYFEGEAPESAIASIIPGSPVDITVDALTGRKFAGKVTNLSPQASSVGRLFSVRIQFLAMPAEIKPGMFARGSIAIKTVAAATVVPSSAIVRRGGQDMVFTVSNNTAKEAKVTRGLEQGGFTQVTGVAPGEQVVVKGQNELVDGSKVTIEAPKSATAEPGSAGG